MALGATSASTRRGSESGPAVVGQRRTRVFAPACCALLDEARRLHLLNRRFDGFEAAVGVEDLEAFGGEVG